jgi:hypothetical protein
MMSTVGDNEPGRPVPPEQPLPPGWTAEQLRQFQEFQQFQDFLRFTQAQQQGQQPQGGPGSDLVPITSPESMPVVPGRPLPAVPPPAHELHRHLDQMRTQLAELTEGQARIERVTNPPWWRKLLRSRAASWLIGFVVLVIVAIWLVPALVHHYLGGGTDSSGGGPGAALPAPKSASHELPAHPSDTVSDVYLFVAGNNTAQACFLFNDTAKAQFARAAGAANCQAAVTALATKVTDGNAYAIPDLTLLPEPLTGVTTDTISSCSFSVSGGPMLGVFSLGQQADGGWEITGYTAPVACPPPTSAAVPTS